MKIIASTGEKWLFEATSEEVANLTGFASSYSSGFDKSGLDVGTQFAVGSIYKGAFDALNTQRVALDAAKKLRAAGDRFLSFFNAPTGKV